jgi:hypothetical protein
VLTPDDAYAECDVPVYDSGTEAAEAGLAAIKRPPREALEAQRKLVRRGAGKVRNDD